MKTTIEISDALLAEAKQFAAQQGTTVRALVESGLRRVLAERKARATPFRLRQASFNGKGLNPELQRQGWSRLHDLAYEGGGE